MNGLPSWSFAGMRRRRRKGEGRVRWGVARVIRSLEGGVALGRTYSTVEDVDWAGPRRVKARSTGKEQSGSRRP